MHSAYCALPQYSARKTHYVSTEIIEWIDLNTIFWECRSPASLRYVANASVVHFAELRNFVPEICSFHSLK